MLKNTPQRWLDLEKFAKAILPRPEEHEIVRINYFTARIKYDPSRPTEAFNQDRYLEALTMRRKVGPVVSFLHVDAVTLKKLVSTLLMSEIIEDEMVGGGKIVYSLRSAA